MYKPRICFAIHYRETSAGFAPQIKCNRFINKCIEIILLRHIILPFQYILKQLFISVSVASAGYLPRPSMLGKYPSLATYFSVNSSWLFPSGQTRTAWNYTSNFTWYVLVIRFWWLTGWLLIPYIPTPFLKCFLHCPFYTEVVTRTWFTSRWLFSFEPVPVTYNFQFRLKVKLLRCSRVVVLHVFYNGLYQGITIQ